MEKLTVKAKVKEFEIKDPNQPFKDDRLGRKDYAEILTDIVETFVGGAVIALNGAWGLSDKPTTKTKNRNRNEENRRQIVDFIADNGISDAKTISKTIGLKPSRTRDYLKQLVDMAGFFLVNCHIKNQPTVTSKIGQLPHQNLLN